MANIGCLWRRWLERLENTWTEHSLLISALLGAFCSILYYYNYISNLRQTIANVVVFASIIVGMLGVFLTLIITLKESPVFDRMRSFFPKIEEKLFVWIRNQIWSGIFVVMLSVVISIMPNPTNRLITSSGVFIWTTIFWHICFGSFYTVKLITDLILKNVTQPIRKFKP